MVQSAELYSYNALYSSTTSMRNEGFGQPLEVEPTLSTHARGSAGEEVDERSATHSFRS